MTIEHICCIHAHGQTLVEAVESLEYKLMALPDWCIYGESGAVRSTDHGHTVFQCYQLPENQEDLVT